MTTGPQEHQLKSVTLFLWPSNFYGLFHNQVIAAIQMGNCMFSFCLCALWLLQVVSKIGDILVEQWSGENGRQMLWLFGEFCSKQKEIVTMYKDMLKNDKKFQDFVTVSDAMYCRAFSVFLSSSHVFYSTATMVL